MHHSMLREKARRISNKEKLFKEIRKKTNTAKVGPVMRLRVDFSVETLQARQEQNDFLKVLNDKKCQPEILSPAKSFRRMKISQGNVYNCKYHMNEGILNRNFRRGRREATWIFQG